MIAAAGIAAAALALALAALLEHRRPPAPDVLPPGPRSPEYLATVAHELRRLAPHSPALRFDPRRLR